MTRTGCRSSAHCGPLGERPRATPVFPPDTLDDADRVVATEILHELLPTRRRRANLRVVKRKMSGYQLKHAHHRNAPTIDRRPILTS